MEGLTNYITEENWIDVITGWYVMVDDFYQSKFGQARSLRKRGLLPEVTDSEIIVQSLIVETWFQGKEEVGYAFIEQFLRQLFPRILDLDRFNERRRQLISVIETIRKKARDQVLKGGDRVRIVDSMPITLMTYPRGSRCESVHGSHYAPLGAPFLDMWFALRHAC